MLPDVTIEQGYSRPAHSALAPPRRPSRAFDRTFAPGTLLETCHGWRRVEELRPGDHVHALGGMVPIARTHRQPPDRSRLHWHVPAGELGNEGDLRLNAGQHLAMLHPTCRQLFGTPLVLLPVPATTGFCGIRTVAGFTLRCGIALCFDCEEVVFAHSGTLLHVPGADCPTRHRVLSYRESHVLLARLSDGTCRHGDATDRQAGPNPPPQRAFGGGTAGF